MTHISDKNSPGAPLADHAAVEWAKAYPFDVPKRSYVYCDGKAHFLENFSGGAWRDIHIQMQGRRAPLSGVLGTERMAALACERRHAVVACGSNGAPRRLAQKFQNRDDVVPTLRVVLKNYCIVYAAKFSAYGSIPATLVYMPGVRVITFINLLTERQLAQMDETETLGVAYDRPVLHDAVVTGMEGSPLPVDPALICAYVSRAGALWVDGAALALDVVEGHGVPFPKLSQTMVQSLVRDLLCAGDSVDKFIEQNLNDPDLRAARAKELKKYWAAPPGLTAPAEQSSRGVKYE